jgi:hypothetical protein
MSFKLASKKDIKIKAAISSLAGAGKTFGALSVAKGMMNGDISKVALIQTETGRAQLYTSRLGAFNVLDIHPPFTPQKFISAIEEAEKMKFRLVIIDSLSDAWGGLGGCLDMHQEASDQLKNSFSAWKRITPQWEALLNKILSSELHIFCTIKKKADYVIEADEKGRQVPKKVGLADVIREGTDYRFMIQFEIDRDSHLSRVSKDNTGLFEGREPFLLTEAIGKEIRDWCLE